MALGRTGPLSVPHLRAVEGGRHWRRWSTDSVPQMGPGWGGNQRGEKGGETGENGRPCLVGKVRTWCVVEALQGWWLLLGLPLLQPAIERRTQLHSIVLLLHSAQHSVLPGVLLYLP